MMCQERTHHLSGSPAGRVSHASGQSDASSGQMSPSSSGVSSLGTSWSCPSPTLTPPFPLPPMEGEDDPVEALLQLAQNGREGAHAHMTTVMGSAEPCESMESDEGIVSDQSNEFEDSKKRLKTEHVQTIYQCTWPGCDVRKELCDDIESHVREQHLRRAAPASHEEDDREEEFYYTEIDIPLCVYGQAPQICNPTPVTQDTDINNLQQKTQTTETLIIHNPPTLTATPAPLLSDHMDMARPPHENPEYGGRPILPTSSPTFATIISPGTIQWSPECAPVIPDNTSVSPANQQAMHAVPIAIPIPTFTIATSQHSPGKYIRLSP